MIRRSKPFIHNCEFPDVKLERLETPLTIDNDELEECLDDLMDKGIVESYIGEDGKVWYKLTPLGLSIGREMKEDDDADSSKEQG